MDLHEILTQLRLEKQRIDQAILAIERWHQVHAGKGKTKQGTSSTEQGDRDVPDQTSPSARPS
jgi:hypothetical protein